MLSLVNDILSHPANQPARWSALARGAWWQIQKRLTGSARDIDYHGLQLRCHPDSHSASRAIYFSGWPDYREMRFIADYLRPGDSFIDAGANIGLYTLLARACVGETGTVDAFEPNPDVAGRLRESLDLNSIDNVTIHEIGLAEVEGNVRFAPTADDCTGHIAETTEVGADSEAGARAEIPIGRLDQILAEVPYAMAKFDIEGYEPFAIRGASAWTRQANPPVMLIEMAGFSKRYGITTTEFIEELDRIGYFTAIYHPDGKQLEPITRPWEVPVENVLAVSKTRQQFVESRLSGGGND